MTPRHRLTRAIVRLILLAAVLSAPVFLVAEDFDGQHALLVLASNGVCVLLCLGLLRRLRSGDVETCARTLVFSLLALVTFLATTNGEDVHVNVINFVLIAVLSSVLLGRKTLLFVSIPSVVAMLFIAWRQAVPPAGEELFEARLESIAQFLPTYLVVVTILWLREGEPVTETQT